MAKNKSSHRFGSRALMLVAVMVLLLVPIAAFAVGQTFPDVSPDDWFYDDVEWNAAEGIMNGAEDGNFYPHDPITRAEVAATNHRLFDAIPEGPEGPQGPQGLPGADGADGFGSIAFYTVPEIVPFDVGATGGTVNASPACMPGDQPISGSYIIYDAGWVTNSSLQGTQWVFSAQVFGAGSFDTLVVCAHVTPPAPTS